MTDAWVSEVSSVAALLGTTRDGVQLNGMLARFGHATHVLELASKLEDPVAHAAWAASVRKRELEQRQAARMDLDWDAMLAASAFGDEQRWTHFSEGESGHGPRETRVERSSGKSFLPDDEWEAQVREWGRALLEVDFDVASMTAGLAGFDTASRTEPELDGSLGSDADGSTASADQHDEAGAVSPASCVEPTALR